VNEIRRGKSTLDKKPSKSELERLYINESRWIREVAETLRCLKEIIYRTLQEYGVEARSNERLSQLIEVKLSVLESEVDANGDLPPIIAPLPKLES